MNYGRSKSLKILYYKGLHHQVAKIYGPEKLELELSVPFYPVRSRSTNAHVSYVHSTCTVYNVLYTQNI